MRRGMGMVAAALLLTACGGDSTGPDEPDYPAIAGTYQLSGTFDGLVGVAILGSVTFAAPSSTGLVTGTARVSIPELDLFDAPAVLADAAVTEPGTIAFTLDDGASDGTTWRYTGQVAGSTMSGRHTLSDGTAAFSGDWTLTRQSSAVARTAAAVAPGAPATLRAIMAAVRGETALVPRWR